MVRLADVATSKHKLEGNEHLLNEYKPFILRTASYVLKRYISDSDDAWSVALIAFWEAIDHYNKSKGDFNAYAKLVIKRRLIDYQRKQKWHQAEVVVAPHVFTGETTGGDAAFSVHNVKIATPVVLEERELRVELADAADLFAPYGFTFMDLAECSPKSEKTKAACAKAASYMLNTPDLITKMRHTKRLPLAVISIKAHIPLKLLNRHRRYIIAVVEIMEGDYPGLQSYLNFVRKGMDT